jgi:hypothetical protein
MKDMILKPIEDRLYKQQKNTRVEMQKTGSSQNSVNNNRKRTERKPR